MNTVFKPEKNDDDDPVDHILVGKLRDPCPENAHEVCRRELGLECVTLANTGADHDFCVVRPGTAMLLEKLGLMLVAASADKARNCKLFASPPEKILSGTRLRVLRAPPTEAVVLDAVGVPLPELEDPQWGLRVIGALDSEFTGKGVRVCVIDTGLNILHPDLQKVDAAHRRSFVGDSTVMGTQAGHGTRCAGIVGGKVPPALSPRYSVAPDTELFVAKVMGDGGISLAAIIAAIGWAVENDCAVVSMSLGDEFPATKFSSEAMESAASAALAKGTLIVAGAGNDSMRPKLIQAVDHPANCKSIMAVAAIDQTMKTARYSNAGPALGRAKVDIAAPGISRSASFPTMYKTEAGTSIATPFVAGVAALYAEACPEARGQALWDLLCSKARKLPGEKVRDVGAGLVRAPRKSDANLCKAGPQPDL